jgi:hypothetical protein
VYKLYRESERKSPTSEHRRTDARRAPASRSRRVLVSELPVKGGEFVGLPSTRDVRRGDHGVMLRASQSLGTWHPERTSRSAEEQGPI